MDFGGDVQQQSSQHDSQRLPDSYVKESMRPLVCLMFVTPMLAVYEIGVVCWGPDAMRNGVDVWLRNGLSRVGFGQYFLLPLLTCGILLGWHHLKCDRWRFRSSVMFGMTIESCCLAVGLVAWAHIQSGLFSPTASAPGTESLAQVARVDWPTETGSDQTAIPMLAVQAVAWPQLFGYFGAGIYEELLFRLMLIPTAAGLLRLSGVGRKSSVCWAVVGTSLIFAAAHYELFCSGGEPFQWFSFSFRFCAGLFFATLFAQRGFGIAVGTHAIYDILVGW